MRITQGTFSFLPDLTDEQIEAQMRYALAQRLVDHGRVHRRPAPAQRAVGDVGPPLFDLAEDEVAIADARGARRREAPARLLKVVAYDRSLGRQTTALSFIVSRPRSSPASAWSARRRPTARSATRSTPTPPTRRPASATAASRHGDAATAGDRHAVSVASCSRRAPAGSTGGDVEEVLAELDRELVALGPVKTRIREIAALLVIDRLRREEGSTRRARRCT